MWSLLPASTEVETDWFMPLANQQSAWCLWPLLFLVLPTSFPFLESEQLKEPISGCEDLAKASCDS